MSRTFSKHWIDNYAEEGLPKHTCPECGQSVGAVAGDIYQGTTYDSGLSDWQGWAVLKCGHAIGIYRYADGTEAIMPTDGSIKITS